MTTKGKTALIFPGQGVRPPWVEPAMLEHPVMVRFLVVASEASGLDIAQAVQRNGPELQRSEVIQPALVAVTLALHAGWQQTGDCGDYVAGHSLGELAAWAASGQIAAEDAIRMAALRGRLMAREAGRHGGGMFALHGTEEDCQRALQLGKRAGALCLAAQNSPQEWVLAGDWAALTAVQSTMAGMPVAVAGAWHSPAMAGAVDELAEAMASLPKGRSEMVFLCARSGEEVAPELLPRVLAEQLVRTNRWVSVLRALKQRGVERFVVMGPGKLMRSLIRRTLGAETLVQVFDGAHG